MPTQTLRLLPFFSVVLDFVLSLTLQHGHRKPEYSKKTSQRLHLFCPISYLKWVVTCLDLKRVQMLLQTETILLLLEFELFFAVLTLHDIFFNYDTNTATANADPNAVYYDLFLTFYYRILSVHFLPHKKRVVFSIFPKQSAASKQSFRAFPSVR